MMSQHNEQSGLNRREFLRAGLVGVAGLSAWSSLRFARGASTDTPGERPNIILAMTDDQGWGDVGYNNNDLMIHTPALDEMASNGMRFDRFYAAAPVCSPTRGSCLTGRHPNRYGCFSWGYDLPLDELTLGEALRTAGYTTGHFGKWHLGGIPPVGKGKHNRGNLPVGSHPLRHPGNHGFDEWFSYWNYFDIDPRGFYHNGEPVGPLKGEGSEIIVERALQFIRHSSGRKQPFLAVIWFGSPHNPLLALEKDKALYKDLTEQKQNFYGEITAMDRAMGQLRKGLRSFGIADNTMLWFCSDNGCKIFGSAGGLTGVKAQLWEGGVRVPGLLEFPARISKPFSTAVPASTSDYYPTILELLGIEMPNQPQPIDGISLLPLIDGKMTARPKAIPFEIRDNSGEVTWAALVDNRYKLHKIRIKDNGFEFKLFDLVSDPAEKHDLASSKQDVTERLKKQLEKWQKSVERDLTSSNPGTMQESSLK